MKIVTSDRSPAAEEEEQEKRQRSINNNRNSDPVQVLEDQVKRINLYFISLLIFLIIFNTFSFAYSQSQNSSVQQIQSLTPQQKGILDFLFDNSITPMLLSTFIIAIVGVLITKLNNFKKKLDMIEILTKALAKMKRQGEDREARVELKLKDIDSKIEKRFDVLDKRIDDVDKNTTDKLFRFFSENSFDRKRD